MTATLTLKNIPVTIYERLKASAAANRRSLNSEAIVCLEQILFAQAPAPNSAQLERIRQLRAGIKPLDAKAMDTFKRQGRA